LRESSLPILATPPSKGRVAGPGKNWPGEQMLAPIDLGSRDEADARAAAVVALELGSRLQLVHVVEPVVALPWLRKNADRGIRERQRVATARLAQIQQDLKWAPIDVRVEVGKPAEEISKIASHKSVGLVIMTRRRGQGLFGPRQGSISYQLLTQASVPVLALPGEGEWVRRLTSP
jgi:nucleotide-binding universal stress UspA family protein